MALTATSAEEPSAEEPGAEEPGAEEPSAEEPGAEEPGAEEPGAEEPSRRVSSDALVWSVWALGSLASVLFAVVYAADVPRYDEWGVVDLVTGHEALSWNALWQLHNEHRIVVPRLVYLALIGLTGDFRSIQYLNVGCSIAAAALLIRTAAVIRGRTHWCDGVPALLLLHFGHEHAWLHGFNFQFAVAVLSLAAVARLMVSPPSWWRVPAIGCFTLCLAFSGVNGMVFVPGLAFYAWAALRQRRAGPAGWLAWAPSAAALIAVIAYAATFQPHHGYVYAETLAGRAFYASRTASQLGANAFGPAGVSTSPWPGLLTYPILLAALIGTALSAWSSRGEARLRAVGVCSLTLGGVVLLGAIAWARSSPDEIDAGLAIRHTLLVASVLAVGYVGLLFVPRKLYGVGWVLLGASALAFFVNLRAGIAAQNELSPLLARATRSAHRGATPEYLVERHGEALAMWSEEQGVFQLERLREWDFGPFGQRRWPDEFVFYEPPPQLVMTGGERRRCAWGDLRSNGLSDEIRFAIPPGSWELRTRAGPCSDPGLGAFHVGVGTGAEASDELRVAEVHLDRASQLNVWFEAPENATVRLSHADIGGTSRLAWSGLRLFRRASPQLLGPSVRSVSSQWLPLTGNPCPELEERHVQVSPPGEIRVAAGAGASRLEGRWGFCPSGPMREGVAMEVTVIDLLDGRELGRTTLPRSESGLVDWELPTEVESPRLLSLRFHAVGDLETNRFVVSRVQVLGARSGPDSPM